MVDSCVRRTHTYKVSARGSVIYTSFWCLLGQLSKHPCFGTHSFIIIIMLNLNASLQTDHKRILAASPSLPG